MKAIGFKSSFQLDEGNCFEEFNFDIPHPSGHELLVKVQSISVNPVDTKQRTMPVDKAPRVLGFDAVGVIEKIGDQVSMFQEGDVVFIQVLLTKWFE